MGNQKQLFSVSTDNYRPLRNDVEVAFFGEPYDPFDLSKVEAS